MRRGAILAASDTISIRFERLTSPAIQLVAAHGHRATFGGLALEFGNDVSCS